MPRAHRAHAEWTPSRLIGWAGQTGPATGRLVAGILEWTRWNLDVPFDAFTPQCVHNVSPVDVVAADRAAAVLGLEPGHDGTTASWLSSLGQAVLRGDPYSTRRTDPPPSAARQLAQLLPPCGVRC